MEPFPYRIERLTEARLVDVQRLLAEVLQQNVSLADLHIKYNTAHTGLQFLSSIAYDGDRAIAFYGTVPQVFTNQDGASLVGCHVSDSMTLEAYQRRGLHQQLALAAYAWMRAEGVAVVYGFHSENTYHSCKKLHWKEWGTLRGYWVRAKGRLGWISGLPWAKIWRRLPVLREWHRQRIRRVMAQYAIPQSDYRNSQLGSGIVVAYSPEFVASKRFHANFWVDLDGVIFWLSIDAIVRVGDVHFKDVQQFQKGLGALQRLCRRLGFKEILFQTYQGSPLDKALTASGHQRFDSWIVGYLDLAAGLDFAQYRPNYADQDSF